jgi:hypothetical protein
VPGSGSSGHMVSNLDIFQIPRLRTQCQEAPV